MTGAVCRNVQAVRRRMAPSSARSQPLALRTVPPHIMEILDTRNLLASMNVPRHPTLSPEARAMAELNDRSREIFRQIVESYLATGEPVGSRNLSRILPMTLSPASVRNVMADLEAAGLIFAPHTSAGRLPTEIGLRFFVDAMLEIGDISSDERTRIEAQMRAAATGHTFDTALAEASSLLSGVSRGAGVVVTTGRPRRPSQTLRTPVSRACSTEHHQ